MVSQQASGELMIVHSYRMMPLLFFRYGARPAVDSAQYGYPASAPGNALRLA